MSDNVAQRIEMSDCVGSVSSVHEMSAPDVGDASYFHLIFDDGTMDWLPLADLPDAMPYDKVRVRTVLEVTRGGRRRKVTEVERVRDD